jgi:uncharacterized membrane protein
VRDVVYVVDIVHFIIHFELNLPFHAFFCPYFLVFTWSFSLAKGKDALGSNNLKL